MNIVISGITSLIGNNIADFLQKNENKVLLVGRKKKILDQVKYFKCVNIDWQNPQLFFSEHPNIDVFIHAASINSQDCSSNVKKAFSFNEDTTGELVNLCVKNNVKSFIYLSTIHVYSKNPLGKINESFPANNDNPYPKSKLNAEKLIMKNASKANMKFIILRLSNIIASPVFINSKCWHLLAQNICKSISKKNEIIINSNPNIFRDFIGINQLNKFLKYYIDNLGIINSGIYNFTSGETIKIFELAKKIQLVHNKIFNNEIKINCKKEINYNIEKNYFYSNEKIKSLGFNLQNNFEDEILSLLKFCKKNSENL